MHYIVQAHLEFAVLLPLTICLRVSGIIYEGLFVYVYLFGTLSSEVNCSVKVTQKKQPASLRSEKGRVSVLHSLFVISCRASFLSLIRLGIFGSLIGADSSSLSS